MKLLILFIALSVTNTILQTTEKLLVVKCGKTLAATFSAICFGFYTIVIVYTMCDLPLLAKAGVTAICQFCGVFTVKLIEQKLYKDKVWKIEFTVNSKWKKAIVEYLDNNDLNNYSIIELETENIIFNIYCETQAQSLKCKKLVQTYDGKYFISESKTL